MKTDTGLALAENEKSRNEQRIQQEYALIMHAADILLETSIISLDEYISFAVENANEIGLNPCILPR